MELIWSTVIAVVAYLLKTELLEPLRAFRETLGRIDNRLKYHANIITNSGIREDLLGTARVELREQSCELEARYKQIPFADKLSRLKFLKIPSAATAASAARSLIGLSNAGGSSNHEDRNYQAMQKIRRELRIPELGATADE